MTVSNIAEVLFFFVLLISCYLIRHCTHSCQYEHLSHAHKEYLLTYNKKTNAMANLKEDNNRDVLDLCIENNFSCNCKQSDRFLVTNFLSYFDFVHVC